MRQTICWKLAAALTALWFLGVEPPSTRAADPDAIEKLEALTKAGPVQPAKDDDDLRKLLKERYNAAARGLDVQLKMYYAGKTDLEPVFKAYQRVCASQLELTDDPKEQVQALVLLVDIAKGIEQCVEARVTAGRAGGGDLEAAHYFRLDAEVQLLKAQRKAKEKKK
jgi:hypothetical protein